MWLFPKEKSLSESLLSHFYRKAKSHFWGHFNYLGVRGVLRVTLGHNTGLEIPDKWASTENRHLHSFETYTKPYAETSWLSLSLSLSLCNADALPGVSTAAFANAAFVLNSKKWKTIGNKRKTQECFESIVSEEETHWVLRQTCWVLWKNGWWWGTHWALSPELSEGKETHWVCCLKPHSPKLCLSAISKPTRICTALFE